MSTSQPPSTRRLLNRWREWRRVRNQRWVEKQAAKRPGDAYSGMAGEPPGSRGGGGPGM